MDTVWILAPVAALMSGVVAALVRWSASARTVVAAAVVAFLLAMMGAMFVATTIYFTWPGSRSLVLALWIAAVLMAVSAFPVLVIVGREARDHLALGSAYAPRRLDGTAPFVACVTGLVLAGEILMGRSFGLAAGAASAAHSGNALVALASTTASPWFLFPMALEMTLTLLWLRERLPASIVVALAAQAGMMFFSPPALPGAAWLIASGVATSAAMATALLYLVAVAYRGRRLGRSVRAYVVRFLLAGALSGVGLSVWIASGALAAFAAATVVQMAVFFTAIARPEVFATSGGELREPLPPAEAHGNVPRSESPRTSGGQPTAAVVDTGSR